MIWVKRRWKHDWGFLEIKETSWKTFFIPPVLQHGLTSLAPFSPSQIHLLFRLHLHNFQQRFWTRSVFHVSILPPSFHPSLQLSLNPSKRALSSCRGLETGTGCFWGREGQRSCQRNVSELQCVKVLYVVCDGVIDGEGDEGGGGKRKQRRQSREGMNSMNHRTLSSLLWIYDLKHSTDSE